MVGAGDDERLHELERTELLGAGDGLGDLIGVAGDHDLAGAVEVSSVDVERGAEFEDVLAGAADDRGHAALGLITGKLHQAAALGDDLEAGLEIPDAGKGVSGQFTERETEAGLEVVELAALLEDLGDGVALDVEGGLADAGLGEELGRAFEAGLTEVERQHLGGAVVEVLGGGGAFVQGLPHADDLGALTGE